ncbi:MAG: hypothetical protein AAFQ58_19080 [Pseudomonadota bacterium]
MSQYLTPAEASENWLCPLARTFGAAKAEKGCQGAACALWRTKKILASDPAFVSAVKREMAFQAQQEAEQTGKPAKPSTSYHKSAVATVGRDPEGHGVVATEGYCGLGGPIT